MNITHDSTTLTSRCLRALALTSVLALGATGCGSDSNGNDTTTAAPDAKKAKQALDAGLKAHSGGDLTAAAADYQKALTYDPENKYALYNLALIDEAGSNYGLAEQKYRAALKTDPAYEPALFNLAILRTARAPKEAIGLYKRAVAADTKDAAAWLNLGLLLRAAGRAKEGNADVIRALELNPKLKDPAKSSGQ